MSSISKVTGCLLSGIFLLSWFSVSEASELSDKFLNEAKTLAKLQPTTLPNGLRTNGVPEVSTWGGPVVRSKQDGLYPPLSNHNLDSCMSLELSQMVAIINLPYD